MIRSTDPFAPPLLFLDACAVDLRSGHLSGGRTGRLTERERSLLAYLAAHPLEVVSRDELTHSVFGYARGARTRAVDKAMYSLRKKVERSPEAPEHLLTSFGDGYQFVPLEHVGAPAARPAPPYGTLVGREAEVDAVLAGLASGDLVTVRGPVGVGKSALAHEVRRRWSQGAPALWCDASAATSLGALLGSNLGLDPAPPLVVASRLRRRPNTLVVIDDADEHLGAFGLVEELRAAAPGARWLVTSRTAPSMRDAREVVLEPLSVADASTLFVAAAAEHRHPVADDEARAVVVRFDGLPLAIELCAARLPTFGLAALADPTRNPLDLVEGRPLARIDRHRSLRAALDGPWRALDPQAQRVLSELSALDRPCTLAAIEAVLCEPGEPSICGALDRLEAGSWIQRVGRGGEVRLGLLRVVRAFAAEQLPAERRRELERRAGQQPDEPGTTPGTRPDAFPL